VPRPAIDLVLSCRDVPLREKTLWRMLYEIAAQASEVLTLNIEDLDLDARRAPIRSKAATLDGSPGLRHRAPATRRFETVASAPGEGVFRATQSAEVPVSLGPTPQFACVSPCYEPTAE
jgi:integrase